MENVLPLSSLGLGCCREQTGGAALMTMSQPLQALVLYDSCGLDARHSLSQPGVAHK